eukprot:8361480-Pyramimonas_sp.AAC.1
MVRAVEEKGVLLLSSSPEGSEYFVGGKTGYFVLPCLNIIGPLQLNIHDIRVEPEVTLDHRSHFGVELPLTVLNPLAVATSG